MNGVCSFSTCYVTNTDDRGSGSLQMAIDQVNQGLADEIDFVIKSSYATGGTFKISPTRTFDPIVHTVLIDGRPRRAPTAR